MFVVHSTIFLGIDDLHPKDIDNHNKKEIFNQLHNLDISIAATFSDNLRSITYNDNYIVIGCNNIARLYIYRRNNQKYEQELIGTYDSSGDTFIPGVALLNNTNILIYSSRNNDISGSKYNIMNIETITRLSSITLETYHYVGDINRSSHSLPYICSVTGGREGIVLLKVNEDGSYTNIFNFGFVSSSGTTSIDSSFLCNKYMYALKYNSTFTYHQFLIDPQSDTVTQLPDRTTNYRLYGMEYIEKYDLYIVLTGKGVDFLKITNENTVSVLNSCSILTEYPGIQYIQRKPFVDLEFNLVYFLVHFGDCYSYVVFDIDFDTLDISNMRLLYDNCSYRNEYYLNDDKIFLEKGTNLFY